MYVQQNITHNKPVHILHAKANDMMKIVISRNIFLLFYHTSDQHGNIRTLYLQIQF